MLENDFDSDIIDVTKYFCDFFLVPEMEENKEEILNGLREIEELCLQEELDYFRNHTPKQYVRKSLLNTVSRTATITKKRPELTRFVPPATVIRNPHDRVSIGSLGCRRSIPFSDSFLEENLDNSVQNASHETYTCSPSHFINLRDRSFFNQSLQDVSGQNSSQLTYTCSPRDVMSTTYDKEKSSFSQAEGYVDHNLSYDQLSRSRTSSSETFTKASESLADPNFEEQFPTTGPTSLSSDDLSVSDQQSLKKFSTYSRLKNHNSSRNIPLSFSSNLSTVSSVTGGSEASLNSGLRMNTERLYSAIGMNGSQTISRGKLQPSTKSSSSIVKQAPRASNLIKPKTLNGSRMKLPTNTSSSSSSHSQTSISQSSSQNDLHEECLNNNENKNGTQKHLYRNGTFRVQNSQAYRPITNVFKQPSQPPALAPRPVIDSVNNNCKNRLTILSKSGFGFSRRTAPVGDKN